MKLFGREPALFVATLTALIMFAGTLGFSALGENQAGLWVAAVNAVFAALLAWTTRPLSPGVFAMAVSAIVALGTSYGLNLTEVQINGLNGLLVPVLMFITRGQVSPVETTLTKPSLDPTVEAAKAEGKPVDTSGPVETTA